MTPQAKKILDYVIKHKDGVYGFQIAWKFDIPHASVRRCISEIYNDYSSRYYLETQDGIVRAYRG